MKIKDYLLKIEALCLSDNRIHYSNRSDLDSLAMKISLANNKSYCDLFGSLKELKHRSNEESKEIIDQIAHCLGLLYSNEIPIVGNICFANNKEMRPEFRQTFTMIDVLDYCFAILHSSLRESSEFDCGRLPITSDVSLFWEMVHHGSILREESL